MPKITQQKVAEPGHKPMFIRPPRLMSLITMLVLQAHLLNINLAYVSQQVEKMGKRGGIPRKCLFFTQKSHKLGVWYFVREERGACPPTAR